MLGVKIPALPASLRRTNQRTVISLLLHLGSASRADLAKAAGISQPTAGKITAELLELGVLQETGPASENGDAQLSAPRLGRPGQMLKLDDRHPRFLGLELGIAETRYAALPVAIRWQDEWAGRFPTPQTGAAWINWLKTISSQIKVQKLWGVLISVPGIVDETAGKVLFSPNLHWLEREDLPQLVRQVWDLPIILVQEIRALALGQLTAKPDEDFLLVDFGQGVGGAVVLDGKIFSHRMPISGELGHTPVPGNLRRCGCGAVGCLETLVSEHGLAQSYAAATGCDPTGGREPQSFWNIMTQRVSEHGLEPWLSDALTAAAQVISGALNVLGLSRVVVTGQMTLLPGVVEKLSAEIRNGAVWGRFGIVTCERAPHRRAAGLVAAGIDRLVLPLDDRTPPLDSKPPTSDAISRLTSAAS